MPTIPKLVLFLYCIAWDKSRAILNCRLFAFSLKMILNLILKLNLKMNSNSKLVLNLILNLILNLKMFHVKHKCNHKKPIYGQKIVPPRFSFVKNFFQKSFWHTFCTSPKKKKAPRGEPSRTYENCSICWLSTSAIVCIAAKISSFCFWIISRSWSFLAVK